MRGLLVWCVALCLGEDAYEAVFEAVRSHADGYVDPRQEVRLLGPGHRGIVATKKINKGSLLVSSVGAWVPRSAPARVGT